MSGGLVRHKSREHGQLFFQPLQKWAWGAIKWARADTHREGNQGQRVQTRGPCTKSSGVGDLALSLFLLCV